MIENYKNRFVEIDFKQNQFKREFDKNWLQLPPTSYIALTQVKMKQDGGGRAGRITHTSKAFCVYIKSEQLNLLAYRGKRKDVIAEAQRLATPLNTEVKDMIPRNADGSIDDDDQLIEPENIQNFVLIGVIVIFVIMLITAIL